MSSRVLAARRPLVLVGTLLVANLLGMVGWIWDWQGHLNGVTIQGAHVAMDLGALSIVLALVLAARRTPFSSLMQSYMGSLRTTGGIPFALPLLALALWAAWLWLRAGEFEGWRLAVAGGLTILAVGVIVDVFWHQTHPMVTDAGPYMNTLTLPGHQLQFLGFVIGGLGALIGVSLWRER